MRVLAVLIILLFSCLKVVGSPSEFHLTGLQVLMQENGLPNNTLLEIHQDKRGFLWLGTDVGISRYDGIHFHNYSLRGNEPQAVKRICEMEADHLFWLKLGNNHTMACFDKVTGCFIPLECADSTLLKDIHDLCVADTSLYAITSKGVARLDYHRNKESILISPSLLVEHHFALQKLQNDSLCLYAVDEENNVLIYNRKTQNKKIIDYKRLKTNKPIENIYTINNFLWISTHWNGTYCYNIETDELRRLESVDGLLGKVAINSLEAKNDTTFIAATPHSLLHIAFSGADYMQSAINVKEMSFDSSLFNSFIKNRITKLYVDKKNSVIWLGTFGKGLVKSSMQDKDIHRIFLRDEIKEVNGLAQDAQGYIWLTTNRNGVWKSTSDQISPQLKFEMWEPSRNNGYYCIHKDANGGLWIGDEDGMVQWLNPLTNQIVKYRPKYDGITSVGSIQKIYLCLHNRLWLVTSKGLFIYEYLEDKCVASMAYNETLHKITALAEDGDGIMWLGTNDGVRSAEVANGVIKLQNGREEKAGISKSEVLEVYVNRHNQLYISYADKIVQTDGLREGIYDIKFLQKDMISGHTTCFIDDKSGNTWMGNNIGIMTIQNKTKASYTYAFAERFYDVCQLNNGQLMWSNSLGLMYFSPHALKARSKANQLYISDININYNKVEINEEINGQVILEKPVYQMDELVLSHSNNSIVFYLTDLNYNQMPNKIEYRLLPDYPTWTSSYKAEIEFSNLQAGDYTLEVRPISINEEEVPTTTMKIRIKQHWAATPWAFLCYCILLITFSRLAWSYLKAKAERKLFYQRKEALLKSSLTEEIKNRKEEKNIYKLRNQIRYGVVSEIRTPLSLVIAPLKEMLTDSNLTANLSPKVKVACRNAISMQNICNMMLDIYERENEESNLNVGSYLLSDILNCAIASSNELLNVAPIKLHYDKHGKVKNEVWIDRKKIEYIFRNLLSNAYRHISFAGNIHINIYTEKYEDKEYCCCQIKDDGKNIISESGSYLLNKELDIDGLSNQMKSELGLTLMKDKIVAHHGFIKMVRDTESGTSAVVYIPMGKEHFENDSNVTFVEPEEVKPIEIITAEEKDNKNPEENELTFAATSPTGKYKILVIEDHKDIRLYFKILFSANYHLLMAENGEEGIRLARKEVPDIIISDIMMPGLDGFECTRILKEDIKTCHIPIILLTALMGETNMVKGIELGADDYILKPFNPEVLMSKVKRLIKNRIDLKQTYMKLMMENNTANITEEEKEKKEDPFIRQLFDYVENNLQNPDFNVKRLAEMLNMSQPTLYRRVKMLTNYTIIELIRGVRMKRAAELLKTKKYSIQEVSEMVGYNDAPTFRKHFVDFYGSTPSTFANKAEASEKKNG